jgi:hypothetical protein
MPAMRETREREEPCSENRFDESSGFEIGSKNQFDDSSALMTRISNSASERIPSRSRVNARGVIGLWKRFTPGELGSF